MKRRGGGRACGLAVGWVPLGLALAAMGPPSCFPTPAYQQLQLQQDMHWNAEAQAGIHQQMLMLNPYERWDYHSPADSSRGANEDFRILRGLDVSPSL